MKRIKGRKRMAEKLKAVPKGVRREVRTALEQSAEEITSMQRRLVPVRSGALQRSIGYTFGEYRPDNANVRGVLGGTSLGDDDLSVTLHVGDRTAFYAAFVEFGTSGPYEIGGRFDGATHPGIDGQPFFYPSYRANKRRAKSRITRAVNKGIKKAVS